MWPHSMTDLVRGIFCGQVKWSLAASDSFVLDEIRGNTKPVHAKKNDIVKTSIFRRQFLFGYSY